MRKGKYLFILLLVSCLTIVQAQGTNIIAQGNNFADKLAWLQAFVQSNNSYILEIKADENIPSQKLEYTGRNNITITIKGIGANRVISCSSMGAMFIITSGVTLVLDNNITLRGGGVVVESGGILNMNNGSTITGGNPGVKVFGTFNMNGGTISGNSAVEIRYMGDPIYEGSGVAVYGGTFNMSGGTISNNYGNGVGVNGDSNAGGFYNTSEGVFNMSGGTISGNNNGGVHVNCRNNIGAALKGTFFMNGGTISGNKNGGVFIGRDQYHGSAKFIMNKGTISNNNGKGVFGDGNFTMNDGIISGNVANGNGGGVNVGIFTMTGGTISGNTASGNGGGVSVINFIMTGGTISGNTASGNGGGVFVGNTTFTKTGGIITGYANDQKNGNVLRDSSRNVLNYRGHAVYAGSTSRVIKIKDISSGPTDNMSYDGTNDPAIVRGVWDNDAEPNPPVEEVSFPSGVQGIFWSRAGYSSTLFFTEKTIKASNQNGFWNLLKVSDNTYYFQHSDDTTVNGSITIKLVNGDLVISNDSGYGENNWNGTWKNAIVSTVYINDFANVLSPETIKYISEKSKTLFLEKSVHIVFVTISSAENKVLDDYSLELFDTWNIGKAANNNGILFVIAISSDRYNWYLRWGNGRTIQTVGGENILNTVRRIGNDFSIYRSWDEAIKALYNGIIDMF